MFCCMYLYQMCIKESFYEFLAAFLSFLFPLARPFERSTIRSRSFKKINRAFSVLRRTKSGSVVANPADQGREHSENITAPEGK